MRKQIAELKAEVDARVDDGIDLNAETERAEAWRKYAEKVEKELRAELQTAQADSAALRQLLLSLEWNAPMGNCPDCGGRGPDSGHFTWCRLAPVLATPNPGAELLAEITSLNKSHEVAQDTIRRQWEVIRELRAGQVRHDEPEPPEYQRTADPDC